MHEPPMGGGFLLREGAEMTNENPYQAPAAPIPDAGRGRKRRAGIVGLGDLTDDEIRQAIARGARFVVFQYCVSCFVITFRRSSRTICFIRAGGAAWPHGLPWIILSLTLGWWGVPWGLPFTPAAVIANLLGGVDATSWVVHEALRLDEAAQVARAAGESGRGFARGDRSLP